MNSFIFCSPTKIIFGENTAITIGDEVKLFGGTNALIIYGGGSVVRSGLLKTVTDSLSSAGIKHTCVGGVQPNPLSEFAQEVVDNYKNDGIDFVLAVGGGSAIDTAKAIALALVVPDVPVWDIMCMKVDLPHPLPVGVVVTIAAAGSESSNSLVLTNQALGVKRGLRSEESRPVFAIMDPTLTYSTPPEHTVAGTVDIFMHILDRYFAPDTDNDVTDGIAESLMRVVIKHSKTIIDKPDDYKARSEIFWAGTLAHNGIAGLGQPLDFTIHALGLPFSAKYDAIHGLTLSATWPAWAEYVYKHDVARFAKYARNVWDIDEKGDEAAAKAGIKATVDFFRSIGSPVTIIEAVGRDVSDDMDELIDLVTQKGARVVGAFKTLSNEDIRKILLAAM